MIPKLVVRCLLAIIAGLATGLLLTEVAGWPFYYVLGISLCLGILIGLM